MSKNYLNFEGLSTFLANLKNTFSSKEHTHTVSEIEDYIVDSALSDDSTNPVSNQAIKTEFDVVNADLEARTTVEVEGEIIVEGTVEQVVSNEGHYFPYFNVRLEGDLMEGGKEYVLRIGDLERRGVSVREDDEDMSMVYIGNPGFLGIPFETDADFFAVAIIEPGVAVDWLTTIQCSVSFATEDEANAYVGATVTISEAGTSTPVTEAVTSLEVRVDALEDADAALKSDFESLESSLSNGDVVVSEATHATSADSATTATNAGHATTADSATSATSATKATQDAAGNVIVDTYETKDDAATKLAEAKTYADTAVANLVNSAPETLDTLGELATAFQDNKSVVDTLNSAITTKADKSEIVQSDWNENDESSNAYVKNRTHYEQVAVSDEALIWAPKDSYTYDFSQGNPSSMWYIQNSQYGDNTDKCVIAGGETYRVVWDGVAYDVTSFYSDSYSSGNAGLIGNASLMGRGEDTGEPFLFAESVSECMVYCSVVDTHTFSIDRSESVVVQLDEKYIPDTIARVITEEEMLEIVAEMDLVDPVTDENGAVYTDEAGNVYTL